MLKIRLSRIGRKKRPFYRIVVVDERAKRTGAYIEEVGTYNPLTEPKDIKLKQDRIDYWLSVGAQESDGLLRILGKAPKKPERPAKKSVGQQVNEPTDQQTGEGEPEGQQMVESEEITKEKTEKEANAESEPVVDDSAGETQPEEQDTSESVQK